MRLFFSYLLAIFSFLEAADVVVFSYDRPLQLYAFLESFQKNVKNYQNVYVIYRASEPSYVEAYEVVFDEFSFVVPLLQGNYPAKDFKPITLFAAFSKEASGSKYVIFAVDDIVIKDEIDFLNDEQLLEKHQAYGFFYRLGANILQCYMMNQHTGLPRDLKKEENYFLWHFKTGEGDWKYPNNLDFTLYRKKDLEKLFSSMEFIHPNQLESHWHKLSNFNGIGICPTRSKIVNFPLNLVNISTNRATKNYSTKELLKLFQAGKKMDIEPARHLKNLSPHVDYDPVFINR